MNLSHIFRVLFILWSATEVLTLIVTRTRRSSGETRDRGTLLLLWGVIFCSIWGCMQYGNTHAPTMTNALWLPQLALAILLVGLVLRWTAILSLGKSFSVNVAIHATQTVKRDGLYRFMRHPSYTAMLLIFLGLGMAQANWIALAIVLVPTTLALLYRIRVEEIALGEAFGAEYADYSRTTKRLIPGIY